MYYVFCGHRCFELYAHALVYELECKFPHLKFERRDKFDKLNNIYICFFTSSNPVPVGLRYIMYNAEPLKQDRWKNNTAYWNLLRNATVIWNYCEVSTVILRNAVLTKDKPIYTVPFGCPLLFFNMKTKPEKIYDVGFVGTINERREKILHNIAATGGVKIASPRSHSEKRIFGDDYINFVKKCKIMLAISTYTNKEDDDMFRISLLLSLGCLVIAEGSCDCAHFQMLYPCIIRAPLEKWPRIIKYLLLHEKHRLDMCALYSNTWSRIRWSNFIESKMMVPIASQSVKCPGEKK